MIEDTLRNGVLSEQDVSDIKGTAGTLYAGMSSHTNSTRMLFDVLRSWDGYGESWTSYNNYTDFKTLVVCYKSPDICTCNGPAP